MQGSNKIWRRSPFDRDTPTSDAHELVHLDMCGDREKRETSPCFFLLKNFNFFFFFFSFILWDLPNYFLLHVVTCNSCFQYVEFEEKYTIFIC